MHSCLHGKEGLFFQPALDPGSRIQSITNLVSASDLRATLRWFTVVVLVSFGQDKKRIEESYNDSTTRAECDAKVRRIMPGYVSACDGMLHSEFYA